MTFRFGERKSQFSAEILEGLELEVRKEMRCNGNEVVNVHLSLNFSASTMSGAPTKTAIVERAWKRWNFCPKNVSNGPGDSLGEEGGSPVAEGHCQVEESVSPPSESEELDLARIEEKPPVVPGKVTFPHMQLFPRKLSTIAFNCGDEAFSCGKEQVPFKIVMKVGINVTINPQTQLAEVSDGPPNRLFLHCAERTMKNCERKLTIFEGSKNGTVSKFSITVNVHMIRFEFC